MDAAVQLDLFDTASCTKPALVFVGVCWRCGARTEPVPAEGPGETWKSAEQWLFLTMQKHEADCPPPTRAAKPTAHRNRPPNRKRRTMSTATTIRPEPADGTVVIVTDSGDTDKLIYGRNDEIATGNARWADLTELPADRHRTLSTWEGVTSTALDVQHLGDVVDPAGEEPADGAWLAVKRVYANPGEVYWYIAHRDDSDLPTVEEIREDNGPLEDIEDPAERKAQEDDEAHQLAANWQIESCFAEWTAQWAAMVGDGAFTWQELAVEGNPDITTTVYTIV